LACRRRELIIGSLLYIAGSLLTALWPSNSVAVFMLARATYGFGVGFSMHSAPVYIAEMSPPEIRGLLVSLKEAFIVIGILLSFTVGWIYQDQPSGWREIFGFAAVPALIVCCGMLLLPPSPRWLVLRKTSGCAQALVPTLDFSDARAVLLRVRGWPR